VALEQVWLAGAQVAGGQNFPIFAKNPSLLMKAATTIACQAPDNLDMVIAVSLVLAAVRDLYTPILVDPLVLGGWRLLTPAATLVLGG